MVYINWDIDKLVVNKHELFLIKMLQEKWFVLAEEEGQLLVEREMCLNNGMRKAADRLQELIDVKQAQKSEIVDAAFFLSDGIDDTLFGDDDDMWVM